MTLCLMFATVLNYHFQCLLLKRKFCWVLPCNWQTLSLGRQRLLSTRSCLSLFPPPAAARLWWDSVFLFSCVSVCSWSARQLGPAPRCWWCLRRWPSRSHSAQWSRSPSEVQTYLTIMGFVHQILSKPNIHFLRERQKIIMQGNFTTLLLTTVAAYHEDI